MPAYIYKPDKPAFPALIKATDWQSTEAIALPFILTTALLTYTCWYW